jgi:hypothetical protein
MAFRSWLDALLGAIYDRGTALALSGGLNFTGGLKATLNRTDGRIDAALVNAPQAITSQTGVDATSPFSLTVLAAGHSAGFYLVGCQVELAADELSVGDLTPTWTWSNGDVSGSAEGDPLGDGFVRTAIPQLVYSDGSDPIAVAWATTLTGDEVAIVRGTSLRVSA